MMIESGSPGVSRRRARLAVVDDEPFICDIIIRALSGHHEVLAYRNEVDLYEALGQGDRFDLILCDLMLDGTTGRVVYEALRLKWPEVAPRVVFMTGLSREEAREGVLDGIENRILEKPFRLRELRGRVAEILEEKGLLGGEG